MMTTCLVHIEAVVFLLIFSISNKKNVKYKPLWILQVYFIVIVIVIIMHENEMVQPMLLN
jgi:hypothetical protein